MTTIAAIALTTPDPARLIEFYRTALGFTVEESAGQLRLGAQRVELIESSRSPASPTTGITQAFQHFAMIAPDIDRAVTRLSRANGWSAISTDGPVHLPRRSGGVTAFKFRDPDGHPLELLSFPPGEAPAPWGGAAGTELLGIDHTAIAVTDTARSVAFYEGLGFRAETGTLNTGAEQGRLDGLAAPVVEVTPLSCDGAPPHLELLCYRTPTLARAEVASDDPRATRTILRDAPGGQSGDLRDPDGHRLTIIRPERAARRS